jgi:hypothetical protein
MYDSYTIPVNFTDAGRLLGMFEIRNAVEAVILGIPVVFLCSQLLAGDITFKIIVTLIIFVPVTGFSLIGISDDSLSRYLICRLRYLKRRTILTDRGEVDYREFERTYIWRESQGG